ncbi:MAG: CBS domain-containing protein [Spirochaetaceae bacterium]|nr:MAG: CBS domain-containing protein [Spirochaetaceae bacterium]
MPDSRKLIVIGHRNPDTDSICSAVAYAGLKNAIGEGPAEGHRAGNINAQTRFVLSAFGVSPPPLLTDVHPRLRDIMIPRESLFVLRREDSLATACDIMLENRFSFLPVANGDDASPRRITALQLLALASGRAEGEEAGPLDALFERPVGDYAEKPAAIFGDTDLVRDVAHEVNKYNDGGFIVTDGDDRIVGVVTRMSFLSDTRFRVVMVDHNELAQAVAGIEHAEIVEVIDHHRLAGPQTTQPITFINRVVGSTCTIVADLFRQRGVTPDASTAGLMLAGLLSDTVILKSPTTTPLDVETAARLAPIAGVDADRFGHQMFEAGSGIEDVTDDQVITRDQKTYTESGLTFSVSQIEMIGFRSFWSRRDGIVDALGRYAAGRSLDVAALMVTDITTETTLLAIVGSDRVIDHIGYPEKAPGVFELHGVLSRKKQLLPYLIEIIRAL